MISCFFITDVRSGKHCPISKNVLIIKNKLILYLNN